MISINTNAGAMTAVRVLAGTSKRLDLLQLQATTGLKVNGPKDDASNFAIAQNQRGEVAGLQATLTALATGQSTIDVALDGAKQIVDVLTELKAKVITYRSGTLDAAGKQAVENDFNALLDQIDTIAASSSFNGTNLLENNLVGNVTGVRALIGSDVGFPTDIGLFFANDSAVAATATTDPGPPAGPGPAYSGTTISNPASATVTDVGSNLGVTVPAGGSAGVPAVIRLTPAGGTPQNTRVTVSTTLNFDGQSRTIEFRNVGLNVRETNRYALGFAVGAVSTYDVLSTPQGSTIQVRKESLTAQSLGLRFPALDSGNFGVREIDESIQAAIEAAARLGTASKRMEAQAAFVSKQVDVYKAAIGNLVDADLSETAARLQAEQVKQQLGTQALAIANRAPNFILQLFRS